MTPASPAVLDAAVWSALPVWDTLPPLSVPTAPEARPPKILVVAAHPDDEVLGVGGLLRSLTAQGCRLDVVLVTDGEASHPSLDTPGRLRLAATRREETRAAHAALGTSPQYAEWAFPDTEVAAHEAEVARSLVPLARGADVVVAPYEHDGHRDHDAVGRAALIATEQTGTPLWRYPIWMWQQARPQEVPWGEAAAVPLDEATSAAKRAAVAAYRSQISPLPDVPDPVVLPHEVLAHFDRGVEVVFERRRRA